MTLRKRLNITNGDNAAVKMREAGVQGEIISWNDVLHEGPVNASLSLHNLSELRALFIAERGWADFVHVSGDFDKRDRMLRKVDQFDEIVLWFEEDLYDQLQLLQLLDYFARRDNRKGKVSLVCIKGYLPNLSAQTLAELEPKRIPVTSAQLELAKRAWGAFGSKDPSAIYRIVKGDTSALEFLAAALTRHLEEFPSVENGLSRSEAEALRAIEAGHSTPVAAFLEVAKKEQSIFLGDIVFYWYLERMSCEGAPLVTWKDGSRVVAPRGKDESRDFVTGELTVTGLGREVLAGRKNWQSLNKQSRWLGGVEIKPGDGTQGWRWDPGERNLVHGSPGGSKAPVSPPRKGK